MDCGRAASCTPASMRRWDLELQKDVKEKKRHERVAGNGEGSRKSSSSSGERGPGNFHVFFWLAWGFF